MCSAPKRGRRRSPRVQFQDLPYEVSRDSARRIASRRLEIYSHSRLDRMAEQPLRSVLRFTIFGSMLALIRCRDFYPRTSSKDLATDVLAPEHAFPYTYRPNGPSPFGVRRIPGSSGLYDQAFHCLGVSNERIGFRVQQLQYRTDERRGGWEAMTQKTTPGSGELSRSPQRRPARHRRVR